MNRPRGAVSLLTLNPNLQTGKWGLREVKPFPKVTQLGEADQALGVARMPPTSVTTFVSCALHPSLWLSWHGACCGGCGQHGLKPWARPLWNLQFCSHPAIPPTYTTHPTSLLGKVTYLSPGQKVDRNDKIIISRGR